MNPFNLAMFFNVVPKWRNFAKSGQTGQEYGLLKPLCVDITQSRPKLLCLRLSMKSKQN